jgi:hypothetical protein
MKTTFYKKVGRRYVPVSEYDSMFCDAFPHGDHLVQSYKGGCLTRYNINPKFAPMIAAGRVAEEAISKELMRASDLRMQRGGGERKLTPKQKAAWDNLVNELGDSARQLEWPSARETAQAGVDAMMAQAKELLAHPMIQAAYVEFEAICKLVLENKQGK